MKISDLDAGTVFRSGSWYGIVCYDVETPEEKYYVVISTPVDWRDKKALIKPGLAQYSYSPCIDEIISTPWG